MCICCMHVYVYILVSSDMHAIDHYDRTRSRPAKAVVTTVLLLLLLLLLLPCHDTAYICPPPAAPTDPDGMYIRMYV